MRNLKRALSLAMASVMLLGMMVVANAAYPDVTSANNLEAIEVAQMIGVMEGFEDGTFRPEQNVTRNEMAVIMCHLLNLTPGGSHPFNDVPSWAEPYVAACYNNGIIAGVSANQYNGNANVTAVQAGLMTMKALGYFYNQSEFGDSWKLAVIREAQNVDLYRNIDAYNEYVMTRNDVAQLVLNALEATCVTAKQTNSSTSVQAEGVSVQITSPWDYYAVANKDGKSYYGTDDKKLQLAEKLYNYNLRKTNTSFDDFGRPAAKWEYQTKSVISPEAPDLTYTSQVKGKDLYADLGKPGSVQLFTEGAASGDYMKDGKQTTVPSGFEIKSGNEKKIGGKGAVTEVYIDRTKSPAEVQIISIYSYLVQATEDFDTDDGEVNFQVVSSDGATTLNSYVLKSEDFASVTSVKEDDYLLITIAEDGTGYAVKSVAPATVVSDVKVSAYKANDSVTAGGTKYEYATFATAAIDAGNASAIKGGDLMENGYTLQSTTYDFILDQYGYVVGVETHTDEAQLTDYLFVKEATKVGFDYVAKVLFMDGTAKTVTIAKTEGNETGHEMKTVAGTGTVKTEPTSSTLNAEWFYTYTVNKSGNYELTAIKTSRVLTDGTKIDATSANKATGKVVDGSAATYPATNSTVFVADEKAYTGVKNAPNVAAVSGKYVYTLLDKNGKYIVAAVTEMKGTSTTDASEFVYVVGTKATAGEQDDVKFWAYDAVVKGVKGSIETKNTSITLGVKEIYSYEDGYAMLQDGSALRVKHEYGITGGKNSGTTNPVAYKDGVITVGSFSITLADDAKLYSIDARTDKGNATKAMTASALNTAEAGTYELWAVTVSDTDSKAATVYFVHTA